MTLSNTLPNKKMTKKRRVKREVPKLTFNVRSVEDYSMYASEPATQNLIFHLAIDAIKYGVAENKKVADFMALYGVGEMNTAISIPRTEWKSVLKRAIKFYSGKSEFEKCIDCQQLINTLS